MRQNHLLDIYETIFIQFHLHSRKVCMLLLVSLLLFFWVFLPLICLINPFMHNVVKWLNIKYVWPFYNIMHERVKKNIQDSVTLRKKCPNTEFFWSVFSHMRSDTENYELNLSNLHHAQVIFILISHNYTTSMFVYFLHYSNGQLQCFYFLIFVFQIAPAC